MRTKTLNWIFLALICLFLMLQYHLWVEPGGIMDMIKLKKQFTNLSKNNDKLKIRNHALANQIVDLQKSAEGMEARARHDLGMIKKGETFYEEVK